MFPRAQTALQTNSDAFRGIVLSAAGVLLAVNTVSAQILYEIGDPTDEEQLYVELINRARADAAAEAQYLMNTGDSFVDDAVKFFNVDLDLMAEQFADLEQSLPPLAINTRLQDAAYGHALDQFQNVFQSHTSSKGDSIADRATAAGYFWRGIAENTYAYARSIEHGHAGFQIDWGFGPGGMQDPPGHRLNIHSADFREIGVGVIFGQNSSGDDTVGPINVVQNFGIQFNDVPILTGVAFDDLDGDNFYDVGEGLGGVEIRVDDGFFYAVTTDSGGYSIPLEPNEDGRYWVTAKGADFFAATEIIVTDDENVKFDIVIGDTPIPSVSEFMADLIPYSEPVDSQWAFHETLGLMFTESAPWIFHQNLGWTYAQAGENSGELFMYFDNVGWFWTTTSNFPYMYHVDSGAWLAYSQSEDGTNWLYDFVEETWTPFAAIGGPQS